MPFVWSIGTIIGPAIGGTFAGPHDSFPNLFPKGSLFDRFPYLLPNLICAGLLFVSILLGYFLLEETHPDMQPGVYVPVNAFVSEETPLVGTSDAIKRPAVDLRDENYGTIKTNDGAELERTWTVESEKPQSCNIFTKKIVSVVLALSIFTYHSMTYDHLLPIFLEDDRTRTGGFFLLMNKALNPLNPLYSPGGLGLSLRAVGMIMAVNGVIALFVQAVIFPFAAARIGVYRLFLLVTLLHPVAYLVMPALLYVPESLLYPAIYACLTVRNILAILVYPLLLILIKEATPTPLVLGKVNGMAASAGAACRMAAPPVAGYLYAVGKRMDCTALAWYGSAVVAVIGTAQCLQVHRMRNRDVAGDGEAVLPQARRGGAFAANEDDRED